LVLVIVIDYQRAGVLSEFDFIVIMDRSARRGRPLGQIVNTTMQETLNYSAQMVREAQLPIKPVDPKGKLISRLHLENLAEKENLPYQSEQTYAKQYFKPVANATLPLKEHVTPEYSLTQFRRDMKRVEFSNAGILPKHEG
jgi:hypothetical protein